MIEIVFLTSNDTKLAHARFLCRHYDVTISKQKHYGISYNEPRIQDREQLLRDSMENAYERFKKNVSSPNQKFFFIEDTSVIIHALSKQDEVPGVDVKYWMQENDFQSLDEQLKANTNDRRVEVRSDIVLRLPLQLQRLTGQVTERFTSSITGTIIDREVVIDTQPLYPWLDGKTFNKWFVPDGCNASISLLPIEEAEKHDFRAGAFKQMLNYLAGLKLIKENSELTHTQYKLNSGQIRQGALFDQQTLFIVCGPTCAGKTTLANYISDKYCYYHIEASDYMHLSYYRRHGVGSSVKIGDFAEKALKEDPSIVVNQILKDAKKIGKVAIIITGFRSPKEIESFQEQYPWDVTIVVLYIDAEANIRYERSIKRNRADSEKTRESFDAADKQQHNMGLTDLCSENKNHILNNDSTVGNFTNQFECNYQNLLNNCLSERHREEFGVSKPNRLEEEIVLSLYSQPDSEHFFTTAEIASLINKTFQYQTASSTNKPKSKNNVSRYFNQYYYPFYEIALENSKRKYRLSQSGRGYARWLKSQRK